MQCCTARLRYSPARNIVLQLDRLSDMCVEFIAPKKMWIHGHMKTSVVSTSKAG